jgi:hypothetical protein
MVWSHRFAKPKKSLTALKITNLFGMVLPGQLPSCLLQGTFPGQSGLNAPTGKLPNM